MNTYPAEEPGLVKCMAIAVLLIVAEVLIFMSDKLNAMCSSLIYTVRRNVKR